MCCQEQTDIERRYESLRNVESKEITFQREARVKVNIEKTNGSDFAELMNDVNLPLQKIQ